MSRNEKLATLVNKIPEKLTKAELEQYIDKMKERDSTLVTGTFRNLARPGEKIKFPFRLYKGCPLEEYELEDGHTYTLPYAVAFHLEHNCNIPIYRRLNNGKAALGALPSGRVSGNTSHFYVAEKLARFAFTSSDVPPRSSIIKASVI